MPAALINGTETETFTVSGKFIDGLMTREYERGKLEGEQCAQHIRLDTTGYGSCTSAVVVLNAKTRRELSRMVSERQWHRSGDNPGQAYAGHCKLLRALRNDDGTWQGIVICSTLYDV